jgi:hypothetical protein
LIRVFKSKYNINSRTQNHFNFLKVQWVKEQPPIFADGTAVIAFLEVQAGTVPPFKFQGAGSKQVIAPNIPIRDGNALCKHLMTTLKAFIRSWSCRLTIDSKY